ncbi:hypothetical protein FHX42_000833 [Saccharopolyspora lacisalsi]|uniref:Uncharacterized protein n=1 Tax=Halosaccharopolyspora lacisalsi TaxID=1000566 RepID=A0A839DPS8_9PSEU|nr:hypothetical protein [Halosaccharopolyspora lacisalsi]MBA8823504.1 hypothetical protein [Halosaccharopolyspora lacisalsi]
MRGRARGATRAGLFLLFAVLLAMLAPLNASGERSTAYRAGGVCEHNEHRESEKLRARAPSVAATRRGHERGSRRWAALVERVQHLRRVRAGRRAKARTAPRASRLAFGWMRSAHSRSHLQVYRT